MGGWLSNFISNPLGTVENTLSNPLQSAENFVKGPVEAAAADIGNLYLPGSSLLTNNLISKSAQSQQASPLGVLGQIGSSLYGGFGDTSSLPGGGNITGPSGLINNATSQEPVQITDLGSPAPGVTPGSVPAGTVGAEVGSTASLPAGATQWVTDASGNQVAVDAAGNAVATAAPAAGTVAGAGIGNNSATGAGGGFFGNMSTAQKLALGLSGANIAAALLGAKKQAINTDPYGTGAAAGATATSLLNKFNSGQLMPSDQAGIAQYQTQATAAAKDYYTKAGLADSSMAQQAIAQVGVQADQMRQSALNNMLTQAQTAAGVSSPYVQSMVQQNISQNAQLQAAQSDFASLMMQYGMYSSGTNPSTPAKTGVK